MPDLQDITMLGGGYKIVILRRHFFDNVNSILRRGFITSTDAAVQRIAEGYVHLYKQATTMHERGLPIHIMDYDRLVSDRTKELELSQFATFLGLDSQALRPFSGMIGKPEKQNNYLQYSFPD